jgi:hypothetical protein
VEVKEVKEVTEANEEKTEEITEVKENVKLEEEETAIKDTSISSDPRIIEMIAVLMAKVESRKSLEDKSVSAYHFRAALLSDQQDSFKQG